MTRHEMSAILSIPFMDRTIRFEWEHCAKSFQKIPNDLAMQHLLGKFADFSETDKTILECKINSESYYFGLDLSDCENLTLEKLKELYKNGTWYLYTWCD